MLTKLPLLLTALLPTPALAAPSPTRPAPPRILVTDQGALPDGKTLNTKSLQAAIDHAAATGGATLVFPKGAFLSGALFLKPNVNIELQQGATLQASKNPADFPLLDNVRFEGHFQQHAASLLNLDRCDHFHLTGPGTLDGNGPAYWKANLPTGRPRLCEITNSSDLLIANVHFQNSASWNLHLYNCQDSTIDNCRFEIPDKSRGPSTDGTDIDSSHNITIQNSFYSVDDDCVCLKGNRYDGLDQSPPSPPVDNIHILHCTFARGAGALSLGTEATIIRNVEFDHSTVTGKLPMLRIKLRPDTPGQNYSNIHVHDITLDGAGTVISLEPTHGTKVPPDKAAHGTLSNLTIDSLTGTFASFGSLSGAITTLHDITLRNIHLTLTNSPTLHADHITRLTLENILINNTPFPSTPALTVPRD
ncbi:MAG TPA: glycosyl hydrolase family 28 protein [Phycisphaerae bacterium]|nr:glycosyl hydrolase family 28 protein [Phycisphaerae bacterium]